MRHTIIRWGVYGLVSTTGLVLLPIWDLTGVVPWVGVFLLIAAGYWIGATFDPNR